MRRLAIFIVGIALAVTAGTTGATAAEALALTVHGFSADGRYFAFTQSGAEGDGSDELAETYVIDAERDRFVPGMPVRFATIGADDAVREKARDPAWRDAEMAKLTAETMRRYAPTRPGRLLLRDAAVAASESASYSGETGPPAGAMAAMFDDVRLGRLSLALTEKAFDWPSTARISRFPTDPLCRDDVTWRKGAGFRLVLTRGGKPLVLNDDRTIPASRLCATGYGLAEVHAFDRPDGKVTLAVVLTLKQRGFEGDDRSFLVVTRVLAP